VPGLGERGESCPRSRVQYFVPRSPYGDDFWEPLEGRPPAACRLPPAACRLPPAACRLPPAAGRWVRQGGRVSRTHLAVRVELLSGRGEDVWPRSGRVFLAARAFTSGQLTDDTDLLLLRPDPPLGGLPSLLPGWGPLPPRPA
jgi:hypothetical protein